jgi:hypothetical protein
MILDVLLHPTSIQHICLFEEDNWYNTETLLLCPIVHPVSNIYLLSLGEKVYDIG